MKPTLLIYKKKPKYYYITRPAGIWIITNNNGFRDKVGPFFSLAEAQRFLANWLGTPLIYTI